MCRDSLRIVGFSSAKTGFASMDIRQPLIAQSSVEAAPSAGVACIARLIDQQQQAIHVAINPHFDQLLNVAARLAFDPVRLPRTRPIGCQSALQCPVYRFGVHPRHHQNLSRFAILRNGGDQTVLAKLERFYIEFMWAAEFRHSHNSCRLCVVRPSSLWTKIGT